MIVDWNQHIFSSDTEAYPLHERAVYRPDMRRHPAEFDSALPRPSGLCDVPTLQSGGRHGPPSPLVVPRGGGGARQDGPSEADRCS